MKKYKLIKKYPGSNHFNIGDIVTKCNTGMPLYEGKKLTDTLKATVCSNYVETYPEFWEEVVEKDYEILSILLARSEKHELRNITRLDDKNYISTLLKCDNNVIHSIKRLSDGEIFTIGDKVRIKRLQHDGSFLIDSFYFDCNNDKLLCNGKCTGNGHVSINKIEKVKDPLFTTEDGVDIYKDNDKVFEVIVKNLHMNRNIPLLACNYRYNDKDIYPSSLVFSTEAAAQRYIDSQKIAYITEDDVPVYVNNEGNYSYWMLEIPNSNVLKSNEWKLSNAPVYVKNLVPASKNHLRSLGILRFSTKKAAEEYILMNKPCLSLNDIFGNSNLEEDTVIWYGLRDLAKKKCQ